jgi:hypothetical protein
MKALASPAQSTELALFETPQACPQTPIAAELQAHFDRGGSPAEGVRLVSILERAGARALAVVKPRKEATGRGSRLPADWQPSSSEAVFALDRGMPQARLNTEIEKFRNYWLAKSGAGATKRDWSATFRNWIITAMERGSPFGDAKTNIRSSGPRGPSHSTLALDWARRAAENPGSGS